MIGKHKYFKVILIIFCVISAGFLFSRQREIIGVDQIGVVVSPGARLAVYQAGDRPLVLPLVQHLVRLTAKPIRYELTDAKGIAITRPNQAPLNIGCQVRYQVDDAAKMVASQGAEAPQNALETFILQQLTAQLSAALQPEGASLDDVQTRVILVGDIHQNLKQALTPLGIEFLSFDLFSW